MTSQAQLLFQNESKYGLIEVWQENHLRFLKINDIEQSRLNINAPGSLASPLDYYFLACLLFIDTPNNVLLAGLGGGTIAHYLHNKCSEINGLAVEINPLIAKLAKDYFHFPESNWKMVIGDVQNNDYNASTQQYDLILIDIGEEDRTPKWLTSSNILIQFKNQLSDRGVLVINLLVNNADEFSDKLKEIRLVFNRNTVCISIPNHKNIVVYAFNNAPTYNSSDQLQSRIKKVSDKWGLNFSSFLDQLIKENPEGSGIL